MTTSKKNTSAEDKLESTENELPVAKEAESEGAKPFTFDAEVAGETITLIDAYPQSGLPAVMMFLSTKNERKLAKYVPVVLEQILGEDQLFELFDRGIEVEAMASIIPAWQKARGLTKSAGSDS